MDQRSRKGKDAGITLHDIQQLTCTRDIESAQELIELINVNASNVKHYVALGESYKIDKSNAIYYFKKLYNIADGVNSIREYIELTKFEQSVQGTNFFRTRVLNGTKSDMQKDCVKILRTPFLIKERRFICQLLVCVHKQLSHSQEALCEVQLSFDSAIDPMMTVTQTDNVVQKFKHLKETIQQFVQSDQWIDLFKMAVKAQIVVNLPGAASFGDPKYKLQRNDITAGIMACSKKSQSEIDSIVGVYSVFPDRINSPNIKNLLNNPTNITAQVILQKYPWTDHIVQPKIDGERQLIVLNGSQVTSLSESKYLSFASQASSQSAILECERVDNILFAFDVHMHQEESVRHLRYSDRLLILNQIVSNLSGNTLDRVATLGDLTITVVDHVHILPHTGGPLQDYLKDCFARFNEETYKPTSMPTSEFAIDGIIISENAPETKQQKFKWKPSHLMTVDLYAHKLDKTILPQGYDQAFQGHTPIGLFTHITKNDMKNIGFEFALTIPNPQPKSKYVLIPFQPVIRKNVHIYWRPDSEEQQESVDGKVLELKFMPEAASQIEQWILHRVRYDKNPQIGQFGNYFNIAEQTFFDIINPIEFQSLYDISRISWVIKRNITKEYKLLQNYQQVLREMIYKYAQDYRGKSTKSQFVNTYEYKTVLDLNFGTADDMLVYSQFGFQKMICATAILNQVSELITVKYSVEQRAVPKPLLEILYIDSPQDLQDASHSIKAQQVDCVLINVIGIPEDDTLLCSVLDSVNKDSIIAVVHIDNDRLKVYASKYEANPGKLQLQVKESSTHKRSGTRAKGTDTSQLQYLNPQFGAVVDVQAFQYSYVQSFLRARGCQELQAFNMNLEGNYSQFPKDYLAQLFELKNHLIQQELDFLSLFKVAIYLKKT